MSTFKNNIKHYLKAMLLKRNIFFKRCTNELELRKFFTMIRPVITDKELIRIGDYSDGGYLIPNDLEGIEACFSPGVSSEASFEFALAKYNINCYLADYSVETPPIKHKLFDFVKRYLGAENTDIYMTLESWINEKFPNLSDAILQMDIEGSEYAVIYQTPIEILKKFRIIVIEFHGLDNIFNQGGFDLIYLTFQKILTEFEIVHIHANNVWPSLKYGIYEVPPLIEFTFLRKDRINFKEPYLTFPHMLDVKNFKSNPDIILPMCWRGGKKSSNSNN
jgi:hypothetical protein